MKMRTRLLALIFILLGLLPTARAEEGMWLFNEFPIQQVRERYGFAVTSGWLDHIRLSTVRFNNGGSGSFVSPHGLAMTNHHVGRECIQALSTAEHDYIADGFYAATHPEELPCPQLELNVLVSLEDVTDKVNAGLKPGMSDAERNQAQKAQMATLEKVCADTTGLRCDMVTLYEGGAFHLYRYKKYTDVRLVFAPENDIAFFGGDPDNFTYPRYNLDAAFFRAYENDKPARTDHYLRWSAKGPGEGDVIFVSGNPGSTGRLLTLAQLEFLRDTRYPMSLRALTRWRKLLQEFSARGDEEARIAQDDLFSVENSLKAYTGMQEGLNDTSLMDAKRENEKELRAKVAANPQWQKQFGGAWDAVAEAQKIYAGFYTRYYMLERSSLRASRLFSLARDLVRLAEEKAKPNEQRLPAYRESALPSLELELFSPAPIYDSLEIVNLAHALGLISDELGEDDAIVKELLAGRAPAQRAEELVRGTALKDVAVRKKLAEGGIEAIQSSQDAMIVLAREIDSQSRALLKRYEDEVQGVERSHGSLVAKAVFAARGRNVAPEATFTPRLSYGTVRGYIVNGKMFPWFTTFKLLYERATGEFPYRLPRSFIERKSALDLSTPFNFVNTADIIGGNSGSPVVNTRGEV
ncbi:MAG: S46 family peptidase, partial [Acidobacteria bacterium]|nr:S46 family peptidase [Acidobacteriota bacterium]